MYKVRFKALTQTPVELPGVIRVLSEAFKNSNCSVLEKPSWILASCGDRVIVKAYVQMTRSLGGALTFEGVAVVSIEGFNAVDVVKVSSIIVSSLERAGVGILMEDSS